MKRWVISGILIVGAITGFNYLWPLISNQATISLGGDEYRTTILRNEKELRRGLSGTKDLPVNQAMLFVFPYDSPWAIWMKDMNYPIDIVWLDSGGKVVHFVKEAQPSSYPNTQFRPNTNSRYVIEVASGTIERTGIKKDDVVKLPSGV